MLTPILLFSFSLVLSTVYGSCPPDFELVRDGECRGQLGKQLLNAKNATNTAISTCKAKNMQPLIIRNSEHQSYWSGKTVEEFALALTCNTNTKKWEWSDGSALSYKPPQHDDALDKNCKTGGSWYLWHQGDWTTWSYYDNDNIQIGCTTQLHPPVPTDNVCGSFENDKDDGVCYQISSTAVNFQDAKRMCQTFGAIVASIHSPQANSFVRRLAVSKGKVTGLYLGAATSGKSDDFGWIDGSQWDYDNFYPGFPMKGLGDCVIMDTEGTSGQWVNVDCLTELSVACIRPQNFTAPGCSSGPFVEGQLIYSPGFPYTASAPCDYIISVDAGKKVEVEILLLEANTCCDHLILFENYFGGNVIANLTGEISEKVYTTTTSNFMRVSWQPNGGVNVRGMMFTFRGID